MRYETPTAVNIKTGQQDEPVHVLVVDEREDVREIVAYSLRREGFVVDTADTGRAALEVARKQRPAVVVTDLLLPDMAGTALCTALREEVALADIGILVFTACGDEDDRIHCLEMGADDYVTKPCNVRELTLRIRSLARRASYSRIAREVLNKPQTYRWRGIELDITRQRVTLDGVVISMRRLELKLLAAMMPNEGVIFSRADLMRIVWGVDSQSDSRTVDTHVRRLRGRLGPYGDAIETAHGLGYRWREDREEALPVLRMAQGAF